MPTKRESPHFDCGQLKEILPDYLDETLQDEICEEVRSHLDECEDCRIFVSTVEMTITLYKRLPESDVPQEVRIDLRKLLKELHLRKKDS